VVSERVNIYQANLVNLTEKYNTRPETETMV
jgi:hypothetical protein